MKIEADRELFERKGTKGCQLFEYLTWLNTLNPVERATGWVAVHVPTTQPLRQISPLHEELYGCRR